MKKILEKPYNLLFIASAVIFLQFIAAVICFYTEAVIYFDFTAWTSYFYMAYCAAVCVITALIILKKRGEPETVKFVKLWFAGFFLYAFFEIVFYVKVRYLEYNGFSLLSENIFNLWDNQPLYRLHLCAAVVFLIYCALFIAEKPGKRKVYAGFAGANLLLFGLAVFFMPEAEYLLIDIDASILEVTFISAAREAGIILFMLNMFVFALYSFYKHR